MEPSSTSSCGFLFEQPQPPSSVSSASANNPFGNSVSSSGFTFVQSSASGSTNKQFVNLGAASGGVSSPPPNAIHSSFSTFPTVPDRSDANTYCCDDDDDNDDDNESNGTDYYDEDGVVANLELLMADYEATRQYAHDLNLELEYALSCQSSSSSSSSTHSSISHQISALRARIDAAQTHLLTIRSHVPHEILEALSMGTVNESANENDDALHGRSKGGGWPSLSYSSSSTTSSGTGGGGGGGGGEDMWTD